MGKEFFFNEVKIALLTGWQRRMSLLVYLKKVYSKTYNSRKSEEEDLRECKDRSGEVGVRKIRR